MEKAIYYTKVWRASTIYNSLLYSNLHVRPFVNSCGVWLGANCKLQKLNEEHSLLSLYRDCCCLYLTASTGMCTNTLAKFYTHNMKISILLFVVYKSSFGCFLCIVTTLNFKSSAKHITRGIPKMQLFDCSSQKFMFVCLVQKHSKNATVKNQTPNFVLALCTDQHVHTLHQHQAYYMLCTCTC